MTLGLLVVASSALAVDFGDDNGNYTHDGKCDDPRFAGPGMTATALLAEDVLHDATDCRTAFEAGQLTLRGIHVDGSIDFGIDKGKYSNDGECDDLRFIGPGMTESALVAKDIMHDATDCRTAFDADAIKLR